MNYQDKEDFEKWWESEPFGFDHPDTKMGILELLKVRDERIKELEKKLGCYITTLARISNASDEPDYDDKINVIIREALKQIE